MKNFPLWFIVIIAVGTPLASTWYFFSYQQEQTLAHGTFLPNVVSFADYAKNWQDENQVEISEDSMQGHWTVVHQVSADDLGCVKLDCLQTLCEVRQLHYMLSGAYYRIKRVLLLPASALPRLQAKAFLPSHCYSDFIDQNATAIQGAVRWLDVSENLSLIFLSDKYQLDADSLVKFFPQDKQYRYFVIDPFGRLVMGFEQGVGIKQVYADLKKLLKYSKQIGTIQLEELR